MEVVVFILTDRKDSPRANRVKSLFDHPAFSVNLVVIDEPENLAPHPHLTPEEVLEYYRFHHCLKIAQQHHSASPVIIVKDSTVSQVSPTIMADRINSTLQHGHWDICYLARWLDRCDLHTENLALGESATILAKAQSPHGTQALMLTPQGRDLLLEDKFFNHSEVEAVHHFGVHHNLDTLLNKAILHNQLRAVVFKPNLVSFDSTLAVADADYVKSHDCLHQLAVAQQVASGSGSTASSFSWLWLILIVALIILVMYALIRRQ